ncbi:MAG TPA: 1-acyl-sn-glycerol-3-phosphate acyltransferase, partial [Intrasporangium sp.]|nr:1-acyl-sn-glycerol-3-phosphate acyltransferase [Intrasporangium sp.]
VPRLAKVTVRFGTPIALEAYQGLPAGRARRQLTDDVMDAIAALTGQERANAYNDVPSGVNED